MSSAIGNRGVLAIWHVCTPGSEEDYQNWYLHEHLPERMDVPGFLFGRRSETVSGTPRSFITYVTETADTLTSPAFFQRLGAPTPWTTKVMSQAIKSMSRVVCRRVARLGRFRGSASVTLRFAERPDASQMTALMNELSKIPNVVTSELWETAETVSAPIAEADQLSVRGWKLDTCLLVDTVRLEDAERIASDLSRRFPQAEALVYRVLYQAGNAES